MPFLRFSRDKRGYEHTYLIHTSSKKGAPARILYWYRTPPGVKVGRAAFDPDVRKALETQYPGISFDWAKLMDVTPPPPDAEHWRERRRQEKAARQARQAAERDDQDDQADEPSEVELSPGESPLPLPAATDHSAPASPDAEPVATTAAAMPAAGDPNDAGSPQRKRRRRGGRRRRKGGPADPTAAPMMGGPAHPAEPDGGPGPSVSDAGRDDAGQDDGDGPGDESPDVA